MPDSGDRSHASGDNRRAPQKRLVAGRYLLSRELGHGGMGVVWLATDEFLRRQVAVKELRPPRWLSGEELEIHQRRALQEARSAARIHHPSAVTLFEAIPANEQDDAMYLIMEFVEGPTLAQLVTREGPLPSQRVTAFGLQLLDVLGAAHSLGIVHRDVKPANILITANDQVKLTDFGIAHTIGGTRLTRSGVMGTQAYQAPELFESVSITPAVDLWSLGATLYYAADGRGPFDRDSTGATLRAILLDDLPVPRCEAHLAGAIAHLLQRDPAERASIDQARNELRQVPAEEPALPADSKRSDAITTRTWNAPDATDRTPAWNPNAETRLRPDTPVAVDPEPEAPVKRAPSRRYLSRWAILTAAAVVVAAVGVTVGLLAASGGTSTPKAIPPLHPTTTRSHPTTTTSPTKTSGSSTKTSGSAPATVATSSPLSEDTAGQMVAFADSAGQIQYDSYASGWHGPHELPGTPRADSPIVLTEDGSHAFFITSNGNVVNDYYVPGTGWEGPGPTGGTAEAGSGLAFFQGDGAGAPPAVLFIDPGGRLVYDYYTASGWHGPDVLPGTPRPGSPVAWSSNGTSVYFIESAGDVATDYLSGTHWEGPAPSGGTAEAGSSLSFSAGSSSANTHPALVFMNTSGNLVYDYYDAGWHGPDVLPGTPRPGSPIAWSGDGTSVYFIESNGDVATDYVSGSSWKGAYRTGGTAAHGSALTYAPGNGTAAAKPNLVFVASDGKLAYDWYANGWHGPTALPST